MKNPLTTIVGMVKPSKVTRAIGTVAHETKKHSPLLLTITGGIGLLATAYYAYKAQPRIKEIVEDMEYKRARADHYANLRAQNVSTLAPVDMDLMVEIEESGDLDFNTAGYVKDIAGAVALPAAIGIISLTSIAFSYKIMNGRVVSLTSAVTALTADAIEKEKRLRARLPEEEYRRVTRPTESKTVAVKNEDGSEKVVSGEVKKTNTSLAGAWFSDSSEFVRDDHAYNMQWIRKSETQLDLHLMTSGHILLNHVYDALHMERTEEGAIMGWSSSDNFCFGVDVIESMDDKTGEFYPEIYVKWPNPKPIYSDVDLMGRNAVIF